VGSGVVIFTGKELTDQLKFKLDDMCTNNQAEQLAIIKALEVIQTQQVIHNERRSVVVYTDSKITLDPIRNAKNHNHLVEEIRKRVVTLHKKNWTVEFNWVKAHAGIYGNGTADRLAKEATQINHIHIHSYSYLFIFHCILHVTYSRIAKSAIKKEVRKESIRKWQTQWEETTKGAITKEFFPSVESRLAVNLHLSPNVTTIMTGHGNIRSYLHRIKITESPECPRNHGIQTVDHLIFECKRLKNEGEILQSSAIKDGKWPVRKSELTHRNLQQLIRYINKMDFVKINLCNEHM
jgi:ribonuclease HI